MEIDRLKRKVRAGEQLSAREGLWLVERVNQLRDALAQVVGLPGSQHPLIQKLAIDAGVKAQRDATVSDPGDVVRGNEWWSELALNAPADQASDILAPGIHTFDELREKGLLPDRIDGLTIEQAIEQTDGAATGLLVKEA